MVDVAHAPKAREAQQVEPATGPKDVARTHHRRPGELGEFAKDWRRWSRAERVAAVAIVAVSLIGLPATLALNGL